MAKTSIEELLEAIAAVQVLKVALAKQEEAIALVMNRLDAIEEALVIRPAP